MTYSIVRLAKEFVVKVRGMVIARCTDFSLSINKTTIDITSFDTDGWIEKLADNKDWSISFSSMVTRDSGSAIGAHGMTGLGSGTLQNLFDYFITGTADFAATVGLGGDDSGSTYFEGPGILQDLTMDGAVGDKVTYSGSIEGAGKLKRK